MDPAEYEALQSCDNFVALPPATPEGTVIFGKNSDRPSTEVQEVIYQIAADHGNGATVEV
jgi:secernin